MMRIVTIGAAFAVVLFVFWAGSMQSDLYKRVSNWTNIRHDHTFFIVGKIPSNVPRPTKLSVLTEDVRVGYKDTTYFVIPRVEFVEYPTKLGHTEFSSQKPFSVTIPGHEKILSVYQLRGVLDDDVYDNKYLFHVSLSIKTDEFSFDMTGTYEPTGLKLEAFEFVWDSVVISGSGKIEPVIGDRISGTFDVTITNYGILLNKIKRTGIAEMLSFELLEEHPRKFDEDSNVVAALSLKWRPTEILVSNKKLASITPLTWPWVPRKALSPAPVLRRSPFAE